MQAVILTHFVTPHPHQQTSVKLTSFQQKSANLRRLISSPRHTQQSTQQSIQQITHQRTLQVPQPSTQQSTHRPTHIQMRNGTQSQLWQSAFPHLNIATPEGAWAKQLIDLGTAALTTQAATYHRMMIITGTSTPSDVTPTEVLRYLLRSTTTCKGQTLDQYVGHILQWATRINLPWTSDPMWPLIRRGLRLTSTPRTHALAITPTVFHELRQLLPLDLSMAATIALLTGSRVDEVFRHTPRMYYLVPPSSLSAQLQREITHQPDLRFYVISTGKESKAGPQDPEDLRFLDVMALNYTQHLMLSDCTTSVGNDTTIFTNRATLTYAMNRLGLTDHSFKSGTAEILSELIRDELLPVETLPLILKHKSTQDINSVTAGYLNIRGRANLLQRKQVFRAAHLIWTRIFKPTHLTCPHT